MRIWLLVGALGLSACAHPAGVIDGHNDFGVHYARAEQRWSLNAYDVRQPVSGQGGLIRWKAGGIGSMLMTVSSAAGPGQGPHFAELMRSVDWLDGLAARHRSMLAKVGSVAEFEDVRRRGQIALIPAVEGGDQFDDRIANLRHAYQRGVRSVGLVYDHHNRFGDGAMVQQGSEAFASQAAGGLTALGRDWIAEMNRLGMIVDLSHASERTARDAIDASRAPVIFSHSGVRALADTPRNLSDDVLRAVARRGGIVMVTLVPYLTTTEYWRWFDSGERTYAALVARHGEDSPEVERRMAEWDQANPEPTVSLSHVADQIEHVARVAGHAHVGIGSDFDGMGRFVIPELRDASRLPTLFEELRRRGWSRERIDDLSSRNFLRVWREVERAAER